MEYFFEALEIIGAAAFAISGSLLALQKGMDVFGVCIMGIVTACGGGVMRDLFLGQLPPAMFREPVYALTAIGMSIIMFIPAVRRLITKKKNVYEHILLVTDSLGLGIFTASGVAITMQSGHGDNLFFAVFLGTITGTGGGVLRDVLASSPPYIFVKHIYALASIAGAVLCALLWNVIGHMWAMLACFGLVFVIRILAAVFHWSLPRASGGELIE